MVQVTQTEEEIKIIIELNRLITRKPDIVLLPTYLKFNNPPIFFERHLTQEIDEVASFCRIFKNEARIILIKKEKGIWLEIFQKLNKEELFQKRLEYSDQIISRNKERDEKALERYEQKRRTEITREVSRETALRERVKQFEKEACREAMIVQPKETHVKTKPELVRSSAVTSSPRPPSSARASSAKVCNRLGTPIARPMPLLRNSGKISVNFSSFQYSTPKRESQEGLPRPFVVESEQKPCNTQMDKVE
ncbi:dynein assembly factor 4, axonemal-like [Lucilia sericata]|uniref:dynein assembly factor 4, axonemal-like n=1 Tax=Lucilia sericata TaxID=13632 RepID=UPI0018A861F1|nr:dynein assembly factor 4, axonemal-like [Lucilia sericata]